MAIRWRQKTVGLTISLLMTWQLDMPMLSGVQASDRLSRSIYGERHVLFFDWPLSRIETSLRLPCTFPIKTNLLFSFLHFSAETNCQSATVIVVRTTHQYCIIDRRHTYPVHLICPLLIWKFGECSFLRSLAHSLSFQFLRYCTPVIIVRSVWVV